jgi:acyl-CoA synthetase (AMP-forming)/AMP-acid ligase II
MSFSEISEQSRTNITENAYQAIKNAITTERYSTNQKLTYGDLEKSLRMSKTPIVLAMSRLADEGLVRAEDIIDFAGNHLARYKKSRRIEFVSSPPHTPSGKVLRRQLREPYWQGQDRKV